ncbi:Trypsin-like peptidase domain-containing protein [Azospirillum sp. RU38E]|nr:Trypsin-like peptidase domain-containing protein [Azospirillum sp. RU38E]SNS43686.1 Trypsin-like peptidase domain-containing protein [Azospirillum sp. RU37A]
MLNSENTWKNSVFPVLVLVGSDFKLLGTAFSITDNGIYICARHVVNEISEQGGIPVICNFMDSNNYVMRPILNVVSHDIADICVLVGENMAHPQKGLLKNHALKLKFSCQAMGKNIWTFSYPDSQIKQANGKTMMDFKPNIYRGTLEDFHSIGRDRVMLPFPCYRGTINLAGGTSGGPVFDDSSEGVFGVCLSSFSGQEDVSYYADIKLISTLLLPKCIIADQPEKKVRVIDLINRGFIQVC